MGLPPIPAPKLTQGASRAGFWRAAALYDKRLSLQLTGGRLLTVRRRRAVKPMLGFW